VLGGLEVVAKIVFRFGLDGSFMRFFYDAGDETGRRRLASTILRAYRRYVRGRALLCL